MTLRRAAYSASRWTTAATLIRTALRVLQTMLLARLLAPADFGLMAMASAAATVAALFADFGLSSALMHFPRPDGRTLSTVFWLNLGLACCLAFAFAIAAWPVSIIFGQPTLVPVLLWLSLTFPIIASGQPFRVLAEKEMRFPLLAQQEVGAALVGFGVALAVAFSGGGVFTFVAAALATTTCTSVLSWIRLSAGARPGLQFAPSLAKPFVTFGLHRVGDNFWNTLRMQADVFIAGLFATPSAVAAYSVPRDQCLIIANTIVNPVVTRVGLPIMTKLQHDTAALRAVYLKTIRITASLNFPAYALLALFPKEIVAVLLGGQWEGSAFYLRLFAIWGMIRSTGNPSGSLIYAVGKARLAHMWNLCQFLALVPILWIAAKLGGLPTLAWVMILQQAIVFVLAWRILVQPACGAALKDYVLELMPPLASTCIAMASGYSASLMLPKSAWVQLLGGGTAFAFAYLLTSIALNKPWLLAMHELFAPVLRRAK